MKSNSINFSIDYLQHLFTASEILNIKPDEVWKAIDFLPELDLQGKYYISNYGRVISLYRNKPKELKPFKRKGYYTVTLAGTKYSIHRLVALAFIPNPENKKIVHHKDGNKTNNYWRNLAWATDAENCQEYQKYKKQKQTNA